jgi:DNA-binding NarL/FixJ family response regulator
MSKKLLLIDNNEFSRIYFKDVFWIHPSDTGEYYEVISVKDINEAKDALRKEDISAVIIEPSTEKDYKKGEGTNHLEACEFVRELRADPKTKDSTIIAFSTHDNKTLFKEMIKAGADTFLAKGKQTTRGLVSTIDSILATKEKNL